MVVGVVLLGPKVVLLLYGWAFAPAAPILVVLCLTLIPIFTATLVNGQLVAADRQLAWTGVMAACCIVNPVVNVFLIALFERVYHNGALGASYALLITDTLVGVAAVALLPRDVLGNMGVILPRLARAALASGIMGIAVFFLNDKFVLIPLVAGVATFIGAALVLRVFTPADLDLVKRLARLVAAKVGLRQSQARPAVVAVVDSRLGEPASATGEAR
jgi:O-antigen/teichoic acid export membrane protein